MASNSLVRFLALRCAKCDIVCLEPPGNTIEIVYERWEGHRVIRLGSFKVLNEFVSDRNEAWDVVIATTVKSCMMKTALLFPARKRLGMVHDYGICPVGPFRDPCQGSTRS